MLPSVRKVAALGNSSDPFTPLFLEKVHLSAKAAGVEIVQATVRSADEIEAAFASVVKDGAGALVMQGSLPIRTVADLAAVRNEDGNHGSKEDVTSDRVAAGCPNGCRGRRSESLARRQTDEPGELRRWNPCTPRERPGRCQASSLECPARSE